MSLLTAFIMDVLFATSCTSDEFFGIEEVYDGVDYLTMERIAHSNAYIEFQKQSILCMLAFSNLDTICMKLDSIDGQPIWVSNRTFSAQSVFESRQEITDLYPEYDDMSDVEKQQILNIAINSNKQLRTLAHKYLKKNCMNTKSANYESDAVRWIQAGETNLMGDSYGCSDLLSGANSMWAVGGQYLYAYSLWTNALADAMNLSRRNGVEFGGYAWESDDSGVLIDDPQSTQSELHSPFIPANPYPSFHFHIHPSGNLSPSEADKNSLNLLSYFGCSYIIFDLEGN